MNKILLNCIAVLILVIILPKSKGQSESGGFFNKLMMMMMKNRRRQYVPFPIPFSPISYSSMNPFSFPSTGLGLPIGGYPTYSRSSLVSSLAGANLGPISPLGGIGPLGLVSLPFLSSLRGDQKFLSRSSPIYEPTVASTNLVPQIAIMSSSAPNPASTSNYLITNPATISSTLGANPLTISNLVSPSAFPTISNQPSALLSASSINNNLPLTNSQLMTSASLNNPSFLTTNNNNSSTYSYSNQVNNGNNLLDKTMSGSQGELIKQELKEHHLNNIRIQYLKNLRDHLIKDQQMKEQYFKDLAKKSMLPYPLMEMYEEVKKK